MKAIFDLMRKDLTLLLRDRFGLFWILVFPLVYALFFGAIFSGQSSGGGQIPIAVVDEDASDESRRFVKMLANHPSTSVAKLDDGTLRLESREAARELVRKGRRSAYVIVKEGFRDQGLALFGAGSPGDASFLEVGVDPSRAAEKGYLQGILTEIGFKHAIDGLRDREKTSANLAQIKKDIGADASIAPTQKLLLNVFFVSLEKFLANVDMSFLDDANGLGAGRMEVVDVTTSRDGPRSAFQVSFPSAILWGLIGCAAGFAIMIVRERTLGTMARLRTAPITLSQILAGKGAACFVACVSSIAFLLVIAKLALGIDLGPLPKLAAAIVASGLCFVGIMLLCSLLGRTEQAVAGATWGVMMPFAMLGGGMIPLIAMPPWLQSLSGVSPFKWSVLSLEGAIWRNFSWAEMALPCAILVGVGLLGSSVALLLFRRAEARA